MYVFIIQTDKNGQKVTASFAYETYREAEKKFYTEMAYRADGRNSTRVAIIDSNFSTIAWDQYIKEVVPPNNEE